MKNQLNLIYYTIIFIIIITGVLYILLSIFKFHFSFFTYYSQTSYSSNNANNNNNNNQRLVNSTIAVYLYQQSGSYIGLLSNLPEGINYTINSGYFENGNSNLLSVTPSQIINNTMNIYSLQSVYGTELESNMSLENSTTTGISVSINGYSCNIENGNPVNGVSEQTYNSGSFRFYCILCTNTNNNVGYYYISNPIQINITPGISLLNNLPNTNYYNYTVQLTLINETASVITLSVTGAYSIPDFQTVLINISYPFNNYIYNNGSNIIFFTQDFQNGQYYALPSWYAGENNNNYYFFVNLLEFPSMIEGNNNLAGCDYLPIYIGFTNNNLYTILNGTVGGDPYAIDPYNPASVIYYDNGPNVFPIYVNFYNYGKVDFYNSNYGGSVNNNFYDNYEYDDLYNNIFGILPTYNPWNLYSNITNGNVNLVISSNGPMYGLEMLDGTDQGSYILINSSLLNYYFQNYLNNQGVGLNTFVYFSGIPWYDTPASDSYNPFGATPLVSDAVTLSYVFNKIQVIPAKQQIVGKGLIGATGGVGGYTPIPTNYTFSMFEYGWTSCSNPGPGCSSGYYLGKARVYLCKSTALGGKPLCGDYYYGGSANGGGLYYFGYFNESSGLIESTSSNSYIPFDPIDQQNNNNYNYYGIFYTYYWYSIDSNNPNNVDTYFLVNGNIYNSLLPESSYSWGCSLFGCYSAQAISPEPPYLYLAQSYQNAYETAFVAEGKVSLNNSKALISLSNLPPGFIDGTFGYKEYYGSVLPISSLSANSQYYSGQPYLFISAGSGGGSGYMYLDWVIATFGVPYEINVP